VVVFDGFMTDCFDGLLNTAVRLPCKKAEKFAINSMGLSLNRARPQGALFLICKIYAVCPQMLFAWYVFHSHHRLFPEQY